MSIKVKKKAPVVLVYKTITILKKLFATNHYTHQGWLLTQVSYNVYLIGKT